MRLRPYRKSDFSYIEKWIGDARTHALWCAGKISDGCQKGDQVGFRVSG